MGVGQGQFSHLLQALMGVVGEGDVQATFEFAIHSPTSAEITDLYHHVQFPCFTYIGILAHVELTETFRCARIIEKSHRRLICR